MSNTFVKDPTSSVLDISKEKKTDSLTKATEDHLDLIHSSFVVRNWVFVFNYWQENIVGTKLFPKFLFINLSVQVSRTKHKQIEELQVHVLVIDHAPKHRDQHHNLPVDKIANLQQHKIKT